MLYLASFIAKGIEYSSPVSVAETEEYLYFLIWTLETIKNTEANPQVIYPLLQSNLDKLNKYLAQILWVWAALTFPLLTRFQVQVLADYIACFGNLVKKFDGGSQALNLEIAIAAYKSFMRANIRTDFPTKWAGIQNNMGNAYKDRQEGDITENLEKAITCYQNSLQIYTQAEYPVEWARSCFNMGHAYLAQLQSEELEEYNIENLKKAISCYKKAIQIYTPEAFPNEYAMVMASLEKASEILHQGPINTQKLAIQPVSTLPEKEQNFLMDVLQATWTTWNSEGKPQEVYPLLQANLDKLNNRFNQLLQTWAKANFAVASPSITQNIAYSIYLFSDLMRDFPLGEKHDNVEIAITGYKITENVYNREEFPLHWAELQIHLGIAYEERLLENQAEKWEQAIGCYKNAERIFTRETNSFQWASVQENLGNAYRERILGDREENLERARVYYENALQVYTREYFPREWAIAKHNLGHTYLIRNSGIPEENIEKAIANYEESLDVINRNTFSKQYWALAQMSLGNAYSNRMCGNPVKNLQKAIEYYQNALQIYTSEDFPYQNQQILSNLRLANQRLRKVSSLSNTNDANSQNLEAFIEQVLFKTIEHVLFETKDPQVLYSILSANLDKLNNKFIEMLQEFSSTVISVIEKSSNNNELNQTEKLAIGYIEAITTFSILIQSFKQGDKQTNLKIAIASSEVILRPHIRQLFPDVWGMAQYSLGDAYYSYYKDRFGDEAKSIELAIDSYKKALQIFNREEFPERWVLIKGQLGSAYYDRIKGNKAENIEAAIENYQLALQVYEENDLNLQNEFRENKKEQADLQHKLGRAYENRHKGNKAENLESAINIYKLALQVFTWEEFPAKWAAVQMNLGSAFAKRINGNKVENFDESNRYFKKSLLFFTREEFPKEWADVQINLAVLCYYRGLLKNTADYFKQSIEYCKKALQIYDRTSDPYKWCMIQNNLGLAYSDLIIDENRTENLEEAIKCLKNALEVQNYKEFPYEWAKIQQNLSAVYTERILGSKAENIEIAIDCSEKALQIFTYEDYPVNWAETNGNLLNAYRHRIYGDAADNLRKAISYGEKNLRVFTYTTHKHYWKMILFNLGTCYKNLGKLLQSEEHIEKAIECYKNGLSVIKPEVSPFQWAENKNSLGNAYRHRIRGDRVENYEQAFKCFQQALQIHTREAFPKDYIKTMMNLGNAYSEVGKLHEAYNTFKKAIQAVEAVRGEIPSGDEAKRKLAEECNQIYQGMVKTCIELGHILPKYHAEALEYVERSKARRLVELMNSREVPKGLIPESLWKELQRLRNAISTEQRILEDAERGIRIKHEIFKITNPYGEIPLPDRTKLVQLQQQYSDILDEVNRIAPNLQQLLEVKPIHFKDIQELLPNNQTAIIEWYMLESDGVLCAFIVTRQSNRPILWTSSHEDLKNLHEWKVEYLQSYEQKDRSKESKKQKYQWINDLAGRLKRLAEILHIQEIIINYIPKECKQLILVPHRYLHVLPLHALPFAENICLLDNFPEGVRYAPSCQTLLLVKNQKRHIFGQLLTIVNPEVLTENPLPYTEVEVQSVLRYFTSPRILFKNTATKANLLAESLDLINCLHFSCHGTFQLANLMESGLLLANGEMLTLGEIFDFNLRQCGLVILSACETGITDSNSISDEYIGLPSAFLYAGSLNVIGSLWIVDEISTAFLIIKFYQNLQVFHSVVVALNEAQLWLRDITKKELLEWISENQISLDATLKMRLRHRLQTKSDNEKPFQSPFYWAAFCAISGN